MSFREMMNQNQAAVAILAAVVIVASVGFSVYRSNKGPAVHLQQWYTTDDGETWFLDDARKAPPFEKDGKVAVLARVYRCADGKPFVAYLERLSPEAKAAVENLNSSSSKQPITAEEYAAMNRAIDNGVEVKKPGGKQWIRVASHDPQVQVIMNVQCANPGESPELVGP